MGVNYWVGPVPKLGRPVKTRFLMASFHQSPRDSGTTASPSLGPPPLATLEQCEFLVLTTARTLWQQGLKLEAGHVLTKTPTLPSLSPETPLSARRKCVARGPPLPPALPSFPTHVQYVGGVNSRVPTPAEESGLARPVRRKRLARTPCGY